MSQITLYLDDEAEQLLRQSAQAAGLSNSKWIAELIKKHARQEWPTELKNLAGGYTLYMKNLSKPTYLGCFLIFLR